MASQTCRANYVSDLVRYPFRCATTCRAEGVEVPSVLLALMIRATQVDDVRLLPDIERAVDAAFISENMATIAGGLCPGFGGGPVNSSFLL